MRRRAIRLLFLATWFAMAASHAAGFRLLLQLHREFMSDCNEWEA
jgi:hypothetical protein